MNPQDNPWGLLPGEVRAMDAMNQTGSAKLAARAIGVSPATIDQHMWTAGRKMKTPKGCHLQKHLLWDRFRQSQKDATQ